MYCASIGLRASATTPVEDMSDVASDGDITGEVVSGDIDMVSESLLCELLQNLLAHPMDVDAFLVS